MAKVDVEALRSRLFDDRYVLNGYEEQAPIVRLGRLLRKARERSEFSQAEIAKRAGLSQADVSRIESGMGTLGPTFDTLCRLVRSQNMRLVVSVMSESEAAEVESGAIF